jgi:hypothetical protein
MIKRLLAMTALCVSAFSANATLIGPGGCVGLGTVACPGSVVSAAAAGAIVGDTSILTLSGVFTGAFREFVVDPGSGFLEFVYQFSLTSGGPINHLLAGGYSFLNTDVSYCNNCTILLTTSPAATEIPTSISRSASGDILNFAFANVFAGATTFDLIVQTNARAFAPGAVALTGDGTLVVDALRPVTVPEPSTLYLLAATVLAFAAMRRRGMR